MKTETCAQVKLTAPTKAELVELLTTRSHWSATIDGAHANTLEAMPASCIPASAFTTLEYREIAGEHPSLRGATYCVFLNSSPCAWITAGEWRFLKFGTHRCLRAHSPADPCERCAIRDAVIQVSAREVTDDKPAPEARVVCSYPPHDDLAARERALILNAVRAVAFGDVTTSSRYAGQAVSYTERALARELVAKLEADQAARGEFV